jgi:hypothetical protein
VNSTLGWRERHAQYDDPDSPLARRHFDAPPDDLFSVGVQQLAAATTSGTV